MRIALQISGQPRAYVKGYEYLKKNLLDRYENVDIFIHTWKNKVYDYYDVKTLYNSTRFEVEPPNSSMDHLYPNTPDASRWPPTATISSFYSIFRANQIRVEWETFHGFTYDVVIRTRFDFAMPELQLDPFESREFHPILDTNVFVPGDRQTPGNDFCNDQFAFGRGRVITEYCSTFQYLSWFYEAGVQMIGEDMLAMNLKRANLTGLHLKYIDIPHPFPPGPYNGSYHSLIRDDMELWK